MQCTLMKRSAVRSTVMQPVAAAAGPPATLILLDNEDGTGTIMGSTAGGNLIDISSIASLTPPPTSSDDKLVTVAIVSGMTFKVSAVGPLTADPVTITITATWGDGSIGPFVVAIPVEVKPGPVTGVVPIFGPPVPKAA